MSYQKFTKDVGIIGLTQLLTTLRGLIILPIITKMLGAESYGIWAQLMVTISLIVPPATLCLVDALARFLPAEKNRKEIQDGIWSVITLVSGVALLIALIFISFSSPISSFFGGEKILVEILAFIIIVECLNLVFLNVFRAFQETKKCSFFLLLTAFGETGLLGGAVFLGYGLFGAILSILIGDLIIFLLMGGLLIKRIGVKIPNFSRTKEYLRFSLPIIPGALSWWIVQSSDKYLISFFLGALFVGYYVPAYTLGNIIYFLVGPFNFLLMPLLSKLCDEDRINEVKNYLKYCLKYYLMVAIPSVFGLSILSKQLLIVFSTPEIAQKSYLVLPVVALSVLLLGITVIVAQILSVKKKTKITGIIWIIAAFLNLGLNFIFIPKFGILGAAFTTLFAYTLVFILTWHYSFKELQFEMDWKFISKSIFASVLMALFILWFAPVGLLKTVITIILGALLYGILIFLFKGFDKKEIEFLKGFFKKV